MCKAKTIYKVNKVRSQTWKSDSGNNLVRGPITALAVSGSPELRTAQNRSSVKPALGGGGGEALPPRPMFSRGYRPGSAYWAPILDMLGTLFLVSLTLHVCTDTTGLVHYFTKLTHATARSPRLPCLYFSHTQS